MVLWLTCSSSCSRPRVQACHLQARICAMFRDTVRPISRRTPISAALSTSIYRLKHYFSVLRFLGFHSGCWSDRCLSSFGFLHRVVFDVLKCQKNILPPLSGWLNILQLWLTNSITLNMELAPSSKMSERLTSTRCKTPPKDQQLFKFLSCRKHTASGI